MAQPFSFGFSGDDIEDDGDAGGAIPMMQKNSTGNESDAPTQIKAQSHKVEELVSRTNH
jgi:protein-histidine N-methyltransferase